MSSSSESSDDEFDRDNNAHADEWLNTHNVEVEEDDIDNLFEMAFEELRRPENLTEPHEVDAFFKNYGKILHKVDDRRNENLLHKVVETAKLNKNTKVEDLEPLVRHLVAKYPELLRNTNDDQYNPLYMAIINEKHQLVNAMLSSCRDGKYYSSQHYGNALNDALRHPAQSGRNCLHMVFDKNLDTQTIRALVDSATDETLQKADNTGKTAAHYAFKFEQCSADRKDAIASLIDRDKEFLEDGHAYNSSTFLDVLDSQGVSIYRTLQTDKSVITKTYRDTIKDNDQKRRDQLEKEKEKEKASHRSDKPPATESKHSAARDAKIPKDSRVALGSRADGNKRAQGSNEEGTHRVDDREKQREKMREEEQKRMREQEGQHRRKDRRREGIDDAADPRAPDRQGRGEDGAKDGGEAGREPPPSNTGIRRTNTGRPRSPSPTRPDKPVRGKSGKHSNLVKFVKNFPDTRKNVDKILLDLKLHYLRTRNTEMALSFIYGNNSSNTLISFDYDHLPREIYWDDFEKRFGADKNSGIKFDKALKYVSFPAVRVRHRGFEGRERERRVAALVGNSGRQDMENFFRWLYNKGVRYILRVQVRDLGTDEDPRVHTDLAIQNCLQSFAVEHLDWQKIDLSPETVLQLGSSVANNKTSSGYVADVGLKEVSLQWSGRNAVLRAWSDPEILDALPALRHIYLTLPPIDQIIDSPEWIRQNIASFESRLKRGGRDIEVSIVDKHSGMGSKTLAHGGRNRPMAGPAAMENSHKWMRSTTRFASLMSKFWSSTVDEFKEMRNEQQKAGTPEGIEDDVVVALIDDGISPFDMALSDQILAGKSVDFHEGEQGPPFTSARGHGTAMANRILQVCPMAKIYSIRMRTFPGPNGQNEIDGEYAARAIEAALEQNVSIISMSWSVPVTDEVTKLKLKKAMQAAVLRDVVIFCSAPDKGNWAFSDNLYPAGPFRNDVICIGAAKSHGGRFEEAPENVDFLLPGVDVSDDFPVPSSPAHHHHRRNGSLGRTGTSSSSPTTGQAGQAQQPARNVTGSSVATALAAGLSALLIYCVKTTVLAIRVANGDKEAMGVGVQPNDVRNLARRKDMVAAFRSLGGQTNAGYVEVWDELDKLCEVMDGAESDRRAGARFTSKDRLDAFIAFTSRMKNG